MTHVIPPLPNALGKLASRSYDAPSACLETEEVPHLLFAETLRARAVSRGVVAFLVALNKVLCCSSTGTAHRDSRPATNTQIFMSSWNGRRSPVTWLLFVSPMCHKWVTAITTRFSFPLSALVATQALRQCEGPPQRSQDGRRYKHCPWC